MLKHLNEIHLSSMTNYAIFTWNYTCKQIISEQVCKYPESNIYNKQ